MQPAIRADRDRVVMVYKPDGFNDFSIRYVGEHVTIPVAGVTTVDSDLAAMPNQPPLIVGAHRPE